MVDCECNLTTDYTLFLILGLNIRLMFLHLGMILLLDLKLNIFSFDFLYDIAPYLVPVADQVTAYPFNATACPPAPPNPPP